MFVTPLFKLMADKQASDLFFTAGAPIQIKINGVVMPINNQALDPEQCRKICYELMTETQIKEFESTHEMNFAQSGGRTRQLPRQHLPPEEHRGDGDPLRQARSAAVRIRWDCRRS